MPNYSYAGHVILYYNSISYNITNHSFVSSNLKATNCHFIMVWLPLNFLSYHSYVLSLKLNCKCLPFTIKYKDTCSFVSPLAIWLWKQNCMPKFGCFSNWWEWASNKKRLMWTKISKYLCNECLNRLSASRHSFTAVTTSSHTCLWTHDVILTMAVLSLQYMKFDLL